MHKGEKFFRYGSNGIGKRYWRCCWSFKYECRARIMTKKIGGREMMQIQCDEHNHEQLRKNRSNKKWFALIYLKCSLWIDLYLTINMKISKFFCYSSWVYLLSLFLLFSVFCQCFNFHFFVVSVRRNRYKTAANLRQYSIFARITNDDILLFDGFMFRKYNSYRESTYWQCTKKNLKPQCPCRIITELINGYQMIKTLKGTHNHPHSPKQYERILLTTQNPFLNWKIGKWRW